MTYEMFDQNPKMFWIIFFASLAITVFVYGAFPYIVAKTRKELITKKDYQKLCFWFNAIGLVVFLFINGAVSGAPYFLWTSIFVNHGIKVLGRRGVMPDSPYYCQPKGQMVCCTNCSYTAVHYFEKCPNCGEEDVDFVQMPVEVEQPAEAKQSAETVQISGEELPAATEQKDVPNTPNTPKTPKVKYCSRCGNLIDAETRKCTGCGKQYFKGVKIKARTLLALVVVVAVICIVTLSAICVRLHDKTEKLQKEIDTHSDTIACLNMINDYNQTRIEELSQNREMVDFVNKCVVFIEDDGTEWYHKYSCARFKGESFWAYNVGNAIYQGYEECPFCH